jgi:hypothetical protein
MAGACAADGRSSGLDARGASGPPLAGLEPGREGPPSLRARRRAPGPAAALEKAAEEAPGASVLSSPLDGDIFALLVPAIVAVFLDPAMALIDTGRRPPCAMCRTCPLRLPAGRGARRRKSAVAAARLNN